MTAHAASRAMREAQLRQVPHCTSRKTTHPPLLKLYMLVCLFPRIFLPHYDFTKGLVLRFREPRFGRIRTVGVSSISGKEGPFLSEVASFVFSACSGLVDSFSLDGLS